MSSRNDRTPPRHADAIRQRLLAQLGGGDLQVRRHLQLMASVVVAQMLPGGVVKGGSGISMRRGPAESRASADLDVTRGLHISEDDYFDQLQENLSTGWQGFQGRAVRMKRANPAHIPFDYLVLPIKVVLTYKSSVFQNVVVELVRDEVGSTLKPSIEIADEVCGLFETVGLATPKPIALISIEHQLVQKLHACTTPHSDGTNDRAHDLVDIQLLTADTTIDPMQVSEIGRRLFALRGQGVWPPTITAFDSWPQLYADAARGLPVRPLAEAIEWINGFVKDVSA